MDIPPTPSEAPETRAPAAQALGGRGRLRGLASGTLGPAWRIPLMRQLVRFTCVGLVCTLSSLALYTLCRPGLGAQAANAVALIVTSVMNTALNRRFTFKVRGSSKLAQDHLNGFVAMAIALVLTAGGLAGLHWVDPSASVATELWTTTVTGWVATVVRFSLLRHWIFRRARNA